MFLIYKFHKEMKRGNHKIVGNFADGCWWCFGRGIFLTLLKSTNPKSKSYHFIIRFFIYIYIYFLLLTVTLLSTFWKLFAVETNLCQFYHRLVNIKGFNEEKSCCISVFDFTANVFGINSKTSLFEGKSIVVQRGGQYRIVFG